MAYYSALLSVIELLDDILHPHRFPNSFVCSTCAFKLLHQIFSLLLDSLQDYSFRGRGADPLEARIRDASYRALDIIESQIPEHRHVSNKILGMLLTKSFCLQLWRFDWKEKLQEVGREVDSIVQEVTAFKESQTHEHVVATTASEQQRQKQPQLSVDSNTVVGFDEQVVAIKEKLCGSSAQLQVIPIVGMGGIGKTTLTRHTFHDPLIVYEFDFRGWVTISQDYHVIRVLQDIAKFLDIAVKLSDDLSGGQNEVEHEKRKEIALKDVIHKHLKGRKFLFVIDDVWNINVWDDIKHVFPNDHNGSRILLTTRLANVAEYVSSIDSLYQVQFLDTAASWTLLQNKAFVNESCPLHLENIGRDIASKCRGLPLATVVIGGILSNDKTLRYWESVAENVGSILSKDDEHVTNILSLSYKHLPHHLKPCFLHMGIFPEDYEINISKLIKLWIAEGFLKTVGKSKNLEEIGNDYLKDLVRRNLVIITGKKANGGELKSCTMHDRLRDFCKQRGHDENFFHVTDQEGLLETNGNEKVRRIVVDSVNPFTPWENGNGKYIRAIYWSSKRQSLINVDAWNWDRVDLLRMLEVSDVSAKNVPFAFSNKFHLKYFALNLNFPDKRCIGSSISKIQNLETLIIHCGYRRTISLPSETWKLRWLKYIIIDRMRLPPIPSNIPLQKLEYLHTLQTLVRSIFTSQFIHMISNVKKLKLEYRDTRDNDIWNWHGLNNLSNLLQLEKLDILSDSFTLSHNDLSWRGYVFPQNLKKLTLHGCRLPWEAMMLVGCLKYLEVLKLRNQAFVGGVWELAEGEFLQLKFLLLELLDLMQWSAESTHFPKLQHLRIIQCQGLEEIPLDIGEIATLKSITVHDSERAGYSANKILEEQQELGSYGLQVLVRKSF